MFSDEAQRIGAVVRTLCFALSALSGCLNGIAFIFNGGLALIANVPLLCALWFGRDRAVWQALLGGLTGFLAGLHIYGIWSYGVGLFVGFGLYTGSQMVLYALMLRYLWKRSRWLDVALPVIAWCITEWIRTVGPLSMPASYVGCIADVGFLRWWLYAARWMGGIGVSGLIALAQSALFFLLFCRKTHLKPALTGLGLFFAVGILGVIRPPSIDGTPVKVAIVQGGLANAQYDAALIDHLAMKDVVQSYEILSKKAYASGANLVVWPETAVRAPVLQTPSLQRRLFPSEKDRSLLVAGVIREEAGLRYNSAVAVGPGGKVWDTYDKERLVPGVEDDFEAGTRDPILQTPLGSLGVLICLESVYPQMGRSLKDAEILLVLSNDAGFGRSPISHHMVNRAIVRAVELGRYVLRAGQAGVSAIIDPRGDQLQMMPLFEAGLIEGEVNLRNDSTLYARLGPWPIWICWAALIAIIVWRVKDRQRTAGKGQI